MRKTMPVACAGIILSGGLNSRMDGRNKAFLQIGGRRFIDRIVDTLSDCFSEILLVTRTPEHYAEWDLKVVEDILPIRSPLAGIHAGLERMQADFGFCTGCDAPLLNKESIRVLLNAIETGVDIIVPASGTYFQPLCAVYSKKCIPSIEEQLMRGDLKADHLFDKLRLKKIPYELFPAADPELDSFFNVNTHADLVQARRLLNKRRGAS